MPWFGYAFIAVATLSAVGLLQKRTLQQEHSLEYVTVFSAVKLLILLVAFGPTLRLGVPGTNFFLLGLTGLIGGFAFLMIAKAMRVSEISTVLPILSTEPAIVAFLAFLLLGETISGQQLTGIGLVFIGTYALEIHHDPHSIVRPHVSILRPFRRLLADRGGRLAVIGLLAFSLASVIDRFVLQRVPVTTYLFYTQVFATSLFLGMLLSSQQSIAFIRRGQRAILPIIIVIAALHLASTFAQAKAMSLAAAGLVIGVKRLAVLIDVVLGGRFFHERHVLQKTLASIIILIGVYFIVQN